MRAASRLGWGTLAQRRGQIRVEHDGLADQGGDVRGIHEVVLAGGSAGNPLAVIVAVVPAGDRGGGDQLGGEAADQVARRVEPAVTPVAGGQGDVGPGEEDDRLAGLLEPGGPDLL